MSQITKGKLLFNKQLFKTFYVLREKGLSKYIPYIQKKLQIVWKAKGKKTSKLLLKYATSINEKAVNSYYYSGNVENFPSLKSTKVIPKESVGILT